MYSFFADRRILINSVDMNVILSRYVYIFPKSLDNQAIDYLRNMNITEFGNNISSTSSMIPVNFMIQKHENIVIHGRINTIVLNNGNVTNEELTVENHLTN